MSYYAGKIVDRLKQNNLIISTAESCTGGLVAAALVDVPGVSEYFAQGFVTYSDKAKHKLLKVPKKILKKYTAVSKKTAKFMAAGAAKRANADIAVSVTGIAGPDGGTKEKPVGLVYIGCYYHGKSKVRKFVFDGDRSEVRNKACEAALEFVFDRLCEEI